MPYPAAVGATAHGSDRWIEPNLWGAGTNIRYVVAPNTNNGDLGTGADHAIQVFKSLDSGLTWAEMDGANRIPCKFSPDVPTPSTNASRNISPAIYDPVGKIIYGLYFGVDEDPVYGSLSMFRFSVASPGNIDKWLTPIAGTANQKVPSNGSQFPVLSENKNAVAVPVNGLCASLCRRASDGATIIFFNGDSEVINTVYYNRMYYDILVGGVWQGVQMFPGQAGVEKDYYAWACLTDSADLPHLFYLWQTKAGEFPDNVECYHNSLSITNIVSARQTIAVKNDLFAPGITGSRIIVCGMPLAFSGSLWLPVIGSDLSGNPILHPRLRIITAAEGALPTWSFTSDVTPGGTVTPNGPFDIGSIHDTTDFNIVGLTGTASLYAVWSTGGSVYYRASADSGATWGSVVTVVDSHSDPFPFRWLLEAAAVGPTCMGIYFSADGEFYWWPVDYMEVCFQLGIDCNNPPGGTVGVPYSHLLQASGGTQPYTFAITAGALPTGLSLNASTGLISGTPTTPGTFVFTVQVTDAVAATASVQCSIVITGGGGGPTIDCNSPPQGSVGAPYSHQITASGGTPPYSFQILMGALPDGLTLDPNTGVIQGTPTLQGTFIFTVRVTDANSLTADVQCSITIVAGVVPLTADCLSPPAATFGVPYFHQIQASGGTPPYTFTITSGSLPPGLTLNSVTGVISGVPTQTGTFNFTIQVTVSDTSGQVVEITCSIVVAPPGGVGTCPDGDTGGPG